MLKILSELFSTDINNQVIEATFGLNAGRLGYQCGLVEGTLVFIGIYGNEKKIEKEVIKDLCSKFACRFQGRFGSMLCSVLRPQGFSPLNPPHLCESLTKLAVKFSAQFINSELSPLGRTDRS
jgi:hypothetical protein